MKCGTLRTSTKWLGAWLFAAGLCCLAGCAEMWGRDGSASISPLATVVQQPSTATSPTWTPMPGPVALVVLHTNDNWGETEPCG